MANLQGPPQEGCLHYGTQSTYIVLPEKWDRVFCARTAPFSPPERSTWMPPLDTRRFITRQNLVDKWTAGPDFPNGDAAGDSFAALLPNGRVLVLGNSGTMYEFDGSKLNPTTRGFR